MDNWNVSVQSFNLAPIVKHDGIVFNANELDTFWRFVHERHTIYHRRHVLKEPTPWTKDPVLQKNKFTNIYRELDPGTVYCREHILEADESREDIVFNVMLYRLMCNIPTYAGLGFQRLSEFTERKLDDYLCDLYNTGQPVFGNAYLISPYSSMGSKFKFRNVARLFGIIHRNYEIFFHDLDTAPTFKRAFEAINDMYGFGPFLAFQVMVDLTYPLSRKKSAIIPFSQDDWAKLGPGALRGFARMSGHSDKLAGLRWLRWNQRTEFRRLGLDFPYLRKQDESEIEISLANMQNSLCEFHKYRSIQSGTGKAQRLFIYPEER